MTNPESSGAAIAFETTRFGTIEIPESDVVTMPEGLVGFGQFHRYTILKDPEQEPFLWLQSIEVPELAFVVVNPFIFFPGYEIKIKPSEIASVQIEDVNKAEVLCIVTIPSDPMELTANLRGPLVFNIEAKLAKQMVLIDDRYHTKHYLLKDVPPHLAGPAQAGGAGAEGGTDAPEGE